MNDEDKTNARAILAEIRRRLDIIYKAAGVIVTPDVGDIGDYLTDLERIMQLNEGPSLHWANVDLEDV